MQWQPTDAQYLQPANLSLKRAPRAYERAPSAPFSRQKMRVGKVWKRIAAPVEIRRRSFGGGGGAGGKPVKKIRLDDGGAVSVARWDGEGEGEDGKVHTPARKIVLRRDRVGDEGLAALSDEEDDGDRNELEEGAAVEVFDEDGTLLDVDPDIVEEQHEWVDEEDEFNPTMMHLGDTIEQAQQQSGDGARDNDDKTGERDTREEPLPADEASVDREPVSTLGEENVAPQTTTPAREEVVLPEGFVSPGKQQPGTSRSRSARKSLGSRRRTLPTEWKPSRLRQSVLAYEDEDKDVPAVSEEAVMAQVDDVVQEEDQTTHLAISAEPADRGAEQEWEDVEDEPDMDPDAIMGDASIDNDHADALVASTTEHEAEETSPGEADVTSENIRAASPVKLPSSPVPSVEGHHPRLPLRRSPRRKSTSPVKQSAIRPSFERPHLVAFTPIKGLPRFPAFAASPIVDDQSEEDTVENDAPPLLERSVSAPPEEPKMSPHRPSRPRVSDDTALLQAFLNRAAETKSSGRRISTSKRESITNRRDSDAVRQALASPAKPEVLADLDPNSPSPRKTTVVSDEIDNANILPEAESSPLQKTRRSGRATRKAAPQTATPAAAPNKISIRGNPDSVVLRKSEAQETSAITRTNTRKNKGGSVLPLYRLDKLRQQGVVDPLDDGMVVDDELISRPNSKGKALRWNETLVEFWQGGDVSETSVLSDELSSSSSAPLENDTMEVEAEVPTSRVAPPPPAETPSKPKIRRLKATRTASTPGKAPSAPLEGAAKADVAETAEAAAPQAKAPAPTKRRSRIATPAKGLGNASLLPADLEPTPAATSAAALAPAPAPPAQQHLKKSIPAPSTTSAGGRRKAPASKLPALSSSSSSSTTTTSTVSQGKENLISSPPKKKAGPGAMPTSKSFAPKLDFGKSLAPPSSGTGSQDDALPGLASPAKKVGRKGGVMFAPSMSAGNGGSQEEGRESREEVPLGLRSPAKKRTRRAVGGGR